MSILTMTPSSEWYEAPDLDDEDEDDRPPIPVEMLIVSGSIGWWTASAELPDLDD